MKVAAQYQKWNRRIMNHSLDRMVGASGIKSAVWCPVKMMSPAGHVITAVVFEVLRDIQVGRCNWIELDVEVLSNTSKPGEFGGHRMTAESRVFRRCHMNSTSRSVSCQQQLRENDIMVRQSLCRVIIWWANLSGSMLPAWMPVTSSPDPNQE